MELNRLHLLDITHRLNMTVLSPIHLAIGLLAIGNILSTTVRADLTDSSFGSVQDAALLQHGSADSLIRPQFEALFGEDEAPPHTFDHQKRYGSGGPYWMSQIKRHNKVAYGVGNSSYLIWRNVKDWGAKGDGVTDDTYAINNATADGMRCGLGCDSSTTVPAIVYFPPGTYMVSAPLILWYYTQFIGNANDLPVIKALPNFYGIGLLDSDVYLPYGFSWYTNQNNFWRQVRNFVLDLTDVPPTRVCHGIHWQVAQATSLQNIVFRMAPSTTGDGSQQMGIFMDNGSGGFLEDLVFFNGAVGFFSGNQQFTCRNLTFNGCATAIYQNWDWVFLYKNIKINNCDIGMDLTSGGEVPAFGSIVLQDSVMSNVNHGIITSFSNTSVPPSAGSLYLDNVEFVNTPRAIESDNGTLIVPGNSLVQSFAQGKVYSAYEHTEELHNLTCYVPTADNARIQRLVSPPPKPSSLLDENGYWRERSRPQYEGVPVESFVSILDYGCIGDGLTDDTQCVQSFLDSIETDQVAYIDHGAYLIRQTLEIPTNIRIQGEIWPLIMIDGSSELWQDADNPVPAVRVGQPGDVGEVQIVEILFETRGPTPGAILMEWNLKGATPGETGMWDTHWRIGGSNGTELQSSNCSKAPKTQHGAKSECVCAFLLLHITQHASDLMMVNNWGWVSDHELDLTDHNQIDIYNGRGLLVESRGPVWIYGGSFEHSMLYNYNVANARDIYMGVIQSETAYMQDNPNAMVPFAPREDWHDPMFSECFQAICYKTYGLRFYNSSYIYIYGAGLYSFFNNYDQGCLLTETCQEFMVSLEMSEAIYAFALNTKAATNMVDIEKVAVVPQEPNDSTFCQGVIIFEYP
ncbi:glycoside hydrolase family 55 protein [Polychaeton citri CBS 116435]|uniref:Glycoside hydrolase family 55 protein n=1 Tax=Polychaeton citri CBS 116435 TaxID=1314669 RepID=A0A9P4PYQ9_9PEZI|nr:glycoside hydrolase family 55 protein [Polychaeton citri CBS 116435]